MNLISGLLMRLGFSIYVSFIGPSIIYSLLLLVGLYALFFLVLRSQKQVLVAISLFFLSSGPGFFKFLRDLAHGYSLGTLLNPATQVYYSRLADEYTWRAGNVIVGILLPQRAFLLGMTMSVWAMVGLLLVILDEDKDRLRLSPRQQNLVLGASALLVGLLPIAHMHSFIVLFMVTGAICLAAYKKWFQLFFYYVIPTATISCLLVFIFVSGGIEKSDFMRWFPGWTAEPGLLPWLVLWAKIWGLMLPLALFGQVLLRKRTPVIQAFFGGFFLVFLVANLVLFQPVTWDNSKLFFWAYLGFSGLAAVALAWLWRHGAHYFSRFDTILLAVSLAFTGAIELVRLQAMQERDRPYLSTQSEISLGQTIRAETAPLARFLTAPDHNHPVSVWGVRPIILGQTTWARNYGFLIDQVERDVKTMFEGGAAAEPLLVQYRVSYVVISPRELNLFAADEDYYAQHYPLAFDEAGYRIYDVRSLTQAQ
ncbi:MAG: hypothetical protein HC873_07615 [Leptolyngbyaceae cyanobacterium SL_1_1]|nr:hypothetical protein [Leptolyngbyaceae cyanobacterium RM1_1_2]NJO09538.1 hypothetical protein [Leptolyngbyaceae cyanobacterium SL_1_1]